jgi:hypothetical protein
LTINPGHSRNRTNKGGENPGEGAAIAKKAANDTGREVPADVQPSDAAAKRTESDALLDRQWIHESGYGGKGGEPRISSDQREASEHSVHLGERTEFSADMLPPGTDVSPPSNQHPVRPHIVKKSQE